MAQNKPLSAQREYMTQWTPLAARWVPLLAEQEPSVAQKKWSLAKKGTHESMGAIGSSMAAIIGLKEALGLGGQTNASWQLAMVSWHPQG